MSNPPNWKKRAEQAQKALAKASNRNADLLERISGLRVALAAVMRRSYPAHVSGVEKALGGHLSDLPDSVLLGYLEAFSLMSTSGRVTTPNDLQEIARALRDSGFPMPEDATAVDMAVAIRGGFQAAKYDNNRLRKKGKKGAAQSKGAESIKRDLTWAESSSGDADAKTKAQKPSRKPAPQRKRQEREQLTITEPANQPEPENTQPKGPELDEATREKFEALEASLLQPAPRFMRDVVSELDSAELAAEWQELQKGAGNWAFIPPQGKHRQRGALLLPKESLRSSIADFSTSPWGRAVAEGYKAGRLYEIAIVLSKLQDNVVVCGFTKHAVEITYRVKGELCALILGLEAGADPWLDVEEAVGRYSTAGSTSVHDVLVIPCPADSQNAVVETLKSAKSANSWHISAPVRVQELTDWVTNDGRGAELIPAS